MSTLTISTTYDTAAVLTEAQLDEIKTPVETYFNTTGIEGSNIQANSLDGAAYLADDSVTTSKIIDDAITTAKLQDSDSATTGITAAKINTNAITTAKLAASSVTTAKINDLAVTTAKINTSAVPKTIMLAIPTASATLVDTVSSGTSETLVGTLSFTGLTSGKPSIISLQSTSVIYNYGYIEGIANYNRSTNGYIILKKDGTTIHKWDMQHQGGINSISANHTLRVPLSCFVTIDIATATSHTYTLYIQSANASDSITVNSAKLVGIQIN